MNKTIVFLLMLLWPASAISQTEILIDKSRAKEEIAPEIYGQFAEHLGGCVYGGLWVGTESSIPNVRGYRADVLNALKDLHVPVLRWPGGCYADDYHWRNGIGPRENRPRTLNIHWGNVVDDNSFGTHEFLDLCELLSCEAYIAGNVGSGSVEEMRDWVEYMTSDSNSTLAELRRKNGRDKPWRIKYFGVGNENWGCGGNMTADYYSDLYRRYATYVRNFSSNRITKVANGPSGRDVPFMDTLIRKTYEHVDAFSMHYYVLPNYDWSTKGKALQFSEPEWFAVMQQSYQVNELIEDYIAILDEVDPQKRIGLYVDEWGTWYERDAKAKTALYQQNSIRDAVSAALFFHVFQEHSDRVRMGNIAQIVNVLQAMILTQDDRMLLTPTYHVFRMFHKHQGAKHIPLDFKSPEYVSEEAVEPFVPGKRFNNNARPGTQWTNRVKAVSVSASLAVDGTLFVSLVNTDPKSSHPVSLRFDGMTVSKVTGEVLAGRATDEHNTFDAPNNVAPKAVDAVATKPDRVGVTLPPMSIVTLAIQSR